MFSDSFPVKCNRSLQPSKLPNNIMKAFFTKFANQPVNFSLPRMIGLTCISGSALSLSWLLLKLQLLNQIVCEFPPEHPLSNSRPLRDSLGHTPLQVLAGAMLGCLVAYLMKNSN